MIDLTTVQKGVIAQIKEEGIKFLCIYWDLDVLSPDDFRSILSSEPVKEGQKNEFADFEYAIDKMKFA